MTAYSNRTYAERNDRNAGQIPVVSITHGHPLNNPHRAPFMSGASAARALHQHAMTQLGNPETGPEFFKHLVREHRDAALDQRALDKRLQTRSRRAARALAASDIELSLPQLELSAEIAGLQAELAERMLPALAADGREPETVIDAVDNITLSALSNIVTMHDQQLRGLDDQAINNWEENLTKTLERSRRVEGRDVSEYQEADRFLIQTFANAITRLEESLPDAVDRPEPLYEIDEIPLDPDLVAETSQRIAAALDADALGFVGTGDDRSSVEDRARSAIWRTMSKAEREAHATKIFLDPQQKIAHGLSIVNSTPPMIRLPETDLSTGRFDVRMATVEEATVVEALLKWAGETRQYPGPEASLAALRDMTGNSAQAAIPGPPTVGITVGNDEASIERVTAIIRGLPADTRILLHSVNQDTARTIMEARTETLRAAGIERQVLIGADDAVNAYGPTSLVNDNDRILGAGPRDHDILVANADTIMAYTARPQIEIASETSIENKLAAAQTNTLDARRSVDKNIDDLAAFAPESDRKAAKQLLGLIGHGSFTAQAFTDLVEKNVGLSAREISTDTGERVKDAVDMNRATLAKGIAAITVNGKINPDIAKGLKTLQGRHKTLSESIAVENRIQKRLTSMRNKDGSIDRGAHYRRSTVAAIAQARIVSEAARQSKLQQVAIPAANGDKNTIKTSKGELVRQNNYEAVRAANMLLEGADFDTKRLRDALNTGIGMRYEGREGFTTTMVAASNVMNAQFKAEKGLEALKDRLSLIPANGAVIIDNYSPDNGKGGNPGTNAVLAWAKEEQRPVIHATAWRVTERNPNSTDRDTRLDLGFAANSTQPRALTPQDVGKAVIVITGGGHMDADTFNALRDAQIADRRAKLETPGASLPAAHGLAPQAADMEIRKLNLANGWDHRLPDVANPQKAQAIMQEAMVDFADNAMVATNLGKDYHVANLIRLAAETGKLGVVIGPKGEHVDLETAYKSALPNAQSMSERTLKDIDRQMAISTNSNNGQMILTNLPGITNRQAAKMMDAFETLAQVQEAAAAKEPHPAIPNHAKNDLAVAVNWANAINAARETLGYVEEAGMAKLTAADHAYPTHMTERAHAPILYAININERNEAALSGNIVGLITGEKATTTEGDLDAVRAIARESAAKDYAVAVHLNGDHAVKTIDAISSMPERERPKMIIIGDGHPATYDDNRHANIAMKAMHEGAVFITPTPPVPSERATRQEIEDGTFPMRSNRDAAASMLAAASDVAVLTKASGRDPALATLRHAMRHEVPVAVVGSVRDDEGKVTNLDWSRSDYAANRKLIAGNAHFEIPSNSRPLAFSPNSIPSIDASSVEFASAFRRMDMERFGQSNDDRPTRLELDPNANKIQSDRSGTISIDTAAPATVVDGRTSMASFIQRVEMGAVPQIAASELDLAARQKAMDDRFLHTSNRDTVSAEIRAEFSSISDAAQESVQRYDTYKTAGSGAGYAHVTAEQAGASRKESYEEQAALLAARRTAGQSR